MSADDQNCRRCAGEGPVHECPVCALDMFGQLQVERELEAASARQFAALLDTERVAHRHAVLRWMEADADCADALAELRGIDAAMEAAPMPTDPVTATSPTPDGTPGGMTAERLAEIRQTHNDMYRYAPITSRVYTLDVRDLLAEVDRVHTWAGVMSLLDEHYPAAVFPGGGGADPGPRIIGLIREVDRLTTERDAYGRRALAAEKQTLLDTVIRHRLMEEVNAAVRERDSARAEIDAVHAELVEAFDGHDFPTTDVTDGEAVRILSAALGFERENRRRLGAEVDRLTTERDAAQAERTRVLRVTDGVVADAWRPRPAAAASWHADHLCGHGEFADCRSTAPAARVVVCGSLSQQADLDGVAAVYQHYGHDVLSPQPSDRPRTELDAEWLQAIERADLVVVVRKPDGSIGAQTTAEVIHALAWDVPVHWLMPSATPDAVTTEPMPCGCTSHDPADHQDTCGHCHAGVDEACGPDCPVDGDGVNPDYDPDTEVAAP